MLENNIKNKKKFNFSEKKNNTIKSLSEVECFLQNLKKINKLKNLYKFLK